MLTFLFFVALSTTVLLLLAIAADEVKSRASRLHVPTVDAGKLVSLSLVRAGAVRVGKPHVTAMPEDQKAA